MATYRRVAGVLYACALFAASASACIFKYGTSPDSLAAHHAGTSWNHGMMGDDWEGVDGSGNPWICKTGSQQSPINVPTPTTLAERIPHDHRTRWSYPSLVSNGSNIEVINNGHTIQIEWLSPYAANVSIVVPWNRTTATGITDVIHLPSGAKYGHVRAVPTQFHFHTTSEHVIGGRYYPLELHIVHRVTDLPACAAGCYTVTGIVFELSSGDDNPLLEAIWENMPMREGEIVYLPAGAEIDLGSLLPAANQRDYVTYEGSLTTPPCSEGLLWHVLTTPQTISLNQWRKYRTAVGMKDCTAANGTATDAAAGESTGHHHHHRHHRRMLTEEAPATGNYTCAVVAYGSNFRAPQSLNGRHVKYAQAA